MANIPDITVEKIYQAILDFCDENEFELIYETIDTIFDSLVPLMRLQPKEEVIKKINKYFEDFPLFNRLYEENSIIIDEEDSTMLFSYILLNRILFKYLSEKIIQKNTILFIEYYPGLKSQLKFIETRVEQISNKIEPKLFF